MYIFLVIQFKNLSFLLDSNVSSISSMAVKNLKRAYLEFGPSVISPTIYRKTKQPLHYSAAVYFTTCRLDFVCAKLLFVNYLKIQKFERPKI